MGMFPNTVQFTDLEINPRDLLCTRMASGPFDESWSRVLIPNRSQPKHERALCGWLLENIQGRFGIAYSATSTVVFFESHRDAILFKLMGVEQTTQMRK